MKYGQVLVTKMEISLSYFRCLNETYRFHNLNFEVPLSLVAGANDIGVLSPGWEVGLMG